MPGLKRRCPLFSHSIAHARPRSFIGFFAYDQAVSLAPFLALIAKRTRQRLLDQWREKGPSARNR